MDGAGHLERLWARRNADLAPWAPPNSHGPRARPSATPLPWPQPPARTSGRAPDDPRPGLPARRNGWWVAPPRLDEAGGSAAAMRAARPALPVAATPQAGSAASPSEDALLLRACSETTPTAGRPLAATGGGGLAERPRIALTDAMTARSWPDRLPLRRRHCGAPPVGETLRLHPRPVRAPGWAPPHAPAPALDHIGHRPLPAARLPEAVNSTTPALSDGPPARPTYRSAPGTTAASTRRPLAPNSTPRQLTVTTPTGLPSRPPRTDRRPPGYRARRRGRPLSGARTGASSPPPTCRPAPVPPTAWPPTPVGRRRASARGSARLVSPGSTSSPRASRPTRSARCSAAWIGAARSFLSRADRSVACGGCRPETCRMLPHTTPSATQPQMPSVPQALLDQACTRSWGGRRRRPRPASGRRHRRRARPASRRAAGPHPLERDPHASRSRRVNRNSDAVTAQRPR